MAALFLLVSTGTWADELCSDRELKIEPDMQMPESAFTLEAAEGALERLLELSREPGTELSWFAEQNALKRVRGWLLKKAAIEALDEERANDDVPELEMFCEFLVNDAFYHD